MLFGLFIMFWLLYGASTLIVTAYSIGKQAIAR
jgi:hypothetical protein